MAFLGIFYAIVLTVRLGLKLVNLRHLKLHGRDVPPELADSVNRETLERIAAYTRERAWIGLLGTLLAAALTTLVMFGGWLERYDHFVGTLVATPVARGVLFFVGVGWVSILASVPLDLYVTFRTEARHGFNRSPFSLWLSDLLKSLLISTLLTGLVAWAALSLVTLAPDTWWLWVWSFACVFGVVLEYVSPYLIEPLFFRMRPLQLPELEREIRELAGRVGVDIGRVLEVDASRRSTHSNAYFAGIGHVKRVVLFDTLLERMSHREILAILAHELGHWKRHHLSKRLVVTLGLLLIALFAAFRVVGSSELPALIGAERLSFPARAVVVGFVGSLLAFPLTPLFSYWSRRHEWEADRFACELTHDASALATALAKLARDNLANLHPHPLYATFYYSHPPMSERVRELVATTTRVG